jgi:hypothetical protein
LHGCSRLPRRTHSALSVSFRRTVSDPISRATTRTAVSRQGDSWPRPAIRASSVRVYVQSRLLRKAGWSWYEVDCRSRPEPFCGGPHHDREEA